MLKTVQAPGMLLQPPGTQIQATCAFSDPQEAGAVCETRGSTRLLLLQSRSQALQAGVHSMQRERVALEQSTNELNGRAKALDRWLSANESKMPPGEPTGRAALMLDPTVQVMPGSLSYEGKLPPQQYPMEAVLHRLQCSRQSSQHAMATAEGTLALRLYPVQVRSARTMLWCLQMHYQHRRLQPRPRILHWKTPCMSWIGRFRSLPSPLRCTSNRCDMQGLCLLVPPPVACCAQR